MAIKVTRVTPPGKKPEPTYRAADIAVLLMCTQGCISDYMNRVLHRKTGEGMTLEEIVQFIEGPRRNDPRSEVYLDKVEEMKRRLYEEYGIQITYEPTPTLLPSDGN